jgi:hypothetical protein
VLSEGGSDGCHQAYGSEGKNDATLHHMFLHSLKLGLRVVACATGRAVLEFFIA